MGEHGKKSSTRTCKPMPQCLLTLQKIAKLNTMSTKEHMSKSINSKTYVHILTMITEILDVSYPKNNFTENKRIMNGIGDVIMNHIAFFLILHQEIDNNKNKSIDDIIMEFMITNEDILVVVMNEVKTMIKKYFLEINNQSDLVKEKSTKTKKIVSDIDFDIKIENMESNNIMAHPTNTINTSISTEKSTNINQQTMISEQIDINEEPIVASTNQFLQLNNQL